MTIIDTDTYWVIGNNKYSKKLYNKEDAARIDATNIGCVNCTNCIGCVACTNCDLCISCMSCTDCTRCTGTEDSTGCTGATTCFYCTNCTDCTSCLRCTGCTNCVLCKKLDNVRNITALSVGNSDQGVQPPASNVEVVECEYFFTIRTNKYSKENHTMQEAVIADASNVGSTDCVDCFACSDCTDCFNCTACERCTGCRDGIGLSGESYYNKQKGE